MQFSKMHGLGNDFVVIDAIRQSVYLTPEDIRFLADRRFGIGCDQVLLVEAPQDPSQALFRYRIFNADGSEVEQCGNGARCFAVFVREQGLTNAEDIPVETLAGPIRLRMEADGQVTVDMGRPRFHPDQLPFIAATEMDEYAIDVAGETLKISAVSMGNPHAVLWVRETASAPVAHLGPALEQHSRFPARVNVGFAALRGRHEIDLRVYERGAGETLACGTGACAAMALARKRGWVDERVKVNLPGGQLVLSWTGKGNAPILMTGPATTVFQGQIQR